MLSRNKVNLFFCQKVTLKLFWSILNCNQRYIFNTQNTYYPKLNPKIENTHKIFPKNKIQKFVRKKHYAQILQKKKLTRFPNESFLVSVIHHWLYVSDQCMAYAPKVQLQSALRRERAVLLNGDHRPLAAQSRGAWDE